MKNKTYILALPNEKQNIYIGFVNITLTNLAYQDFVGISLDRIIVDGVL
jgi:hypothetical protein